MEFLKLRTFSAIGLLLALMAAPLPAAAPSNEYALKSVFLYNFCRFIEWPESAFTAPTDPLVIGIVGQDPFGPLLKEAVAGETYHGRPIQIAHLKGNSDLRRCHLLFVSQSENARLTQILAGVEKQPIVTVGETQDFLGRGGMIALLAEGTRVRLEISPSVIRAARLDVSSKLLRVADLKP